MGNLGKRQIVLLVVLGMVLAYAVYDLLSPSDQSDGKAPTVPSKKVTPEVVDQSKALQKQMMAMKTSPAAVVKAKPVKLVRRVETGWMRDPFVMKYDYGASTDLSRPAKGVGRHNAANLNLTAISRKGKHAFALINEDVLGVGESINGFLVSEIRERSVVLSRNNFTFTIRLREEEE